MVLVAAAGLLSLRPSDAFLVSRPGGGAAAAAGLRRGAAEAPSTQRTAAVRRARASGENGAAVPGLSATGMATEDGQGAVESLLETQKEVSNNDMKPFVVVPKRDPRVWFDAIKDGAVPRPEALVELSK